MTWIPELPPEAEAPPRQIMEWLTRNFRNLSAWTEDVSADAGNSMAGFCSISGTPRPLSGSVGGAPIALDSAAVPGKIIHANAADSGVNAIPACMYVYNPDTVERPIWYVLQGPGIPVPTSRSQMQSQIIPSSLRGPEPLAVPCVIEPGFTLYMSADAGTSPMLLFGMVDEFVSAGVLGYGGLIQRTSVTIGSITSPNYVTIPFDAGQVTNPISVVQDPANNRVQINAGGIWFASLYGTFTCDKDSVNDRVINWRTYDETAGGPLTTDPFPINVENNGNNGLWSASAFFEVAQSLVGHYFRWELGGSTNAFSGVELQKAGVTLVRISPDVAGLSNPGKFF